MKYGNKVGSFVTRCKVGDLNNSDSYNAVAVGDVGVVDVVECRGGAEDSVGEGGGDI